MAEASDYFLTEAQLQKRFETRVKDFVFAEYEPQGAPVLVLLGGQPAAGKSQATNAVQQRHADRHLVPLTGDELRPFHPQHHEIREKEPWLFPDATGQASGAWVRMSIDHALENRYSLMLEGLFRDRTMTLSTAERFAEAGYIVEFVGLAVCEKRSRLDSLHRYLTGGRWTPPDLHDLALRMMPETIAAAEASPAVHRITITDRSGADLYVNERGPDGRWTDEPAAVQALAAGRARPLPADDARRWMERQREVVIDLAARGQINTTSRPVLQRVSVDAEAVVVMAASDAAVARLCTAMRQDRRRPIARITRPDAPKHFGYVSDSGWLQLPHLRDRSSFRTGRWPTPSVNARSVALGQRAWPWSEGRPPRALTEACDHRRGLGSAVHDH